jgi:aspartate/methionine/tyrosine aminotransferase
MERLQSLWENRVEYNLSESGVHPMSLREVLGDDISLEEFLDQKLGYGQTNGSPQLRKSIAELYPGADAENVLVTNGAAEANFLAVCSRIEPGDEIILMLPNYMQIWGLARALRAQIVPLPLREQRRWAPDLDQLARSLSRRTRLIAVCNPNNPTGAVLAEHEMQAIADAARETGAWLVADEVYRGAEREGPLTPSFWGRYEKVLITGGLSKAYGVPGIRLGWIAGPAEEVASLWGCHDYTTIAVGVLSDALARIVLQPQNRRRILERTRGVLRENYPCLAQWAEEQNGILHIVPPAAGAITFFGYHLDIHSTDLMRKLRDEKSVLVVPGEHFGMDGFLRIAYGQPLSVLQAALGRISEVFHEIQSREARR